MKKDLKKLIKTKSPIKGKVHDLIESRKNKKDKIMVVPLTTVAPSTDVVFPEKKKPTVISDPIKNSNEEKELVKRSDFLETAIKNIITNNNTYNNFYDKKSKASLNDPDIVSNVIKHILTNNNTYKKFYNKNKINNNLFKTDNSFSNTLLNKSLKNVSSINNKKVIKDLSSLTPVTNKNNNKNQTNYVTSNFNLNDLTRTTRGKNVLTDAVRPSKTSVPALIEKTNNFYNPIKSETPIKLKTPSIEKFPDVVDVKKIRFSKENKYFTDRVNNMLSNSSSMKIFTTKGNVIKSTKEIINHVKDRQNSIIPMLKSGGLIDKPTLAMLGEYGPEMVAPVSKSNQSLLPEMQPPPSIASRANQTMLERAAYQVNAMEPRRKETPEQSFSVNPNSFSPSVNKQTAPEGSGAGGEAGSSAFSSYFRARMFSLPDWRSRLA